MMHMYLRVQFLWILLLNVVEILSAANTIRGIKWWNLATVDVHDNHIDPTATFYIDDSHKMLTKKQRRLVTKNPGTMVAVGNGAKMAVKECQHQFKKRKWNCPINENGSGSLFGKIMRRGCRETSFVYALTSAAVAHSVSRGCSDGSVFTCSCGERNTYQGNHIRPHDWEWGGCSDNTQYGYKFSRDFVDVVERGRDLRYTMNLHNNEAGRLHVTSSTEKACKCHGMSGSCTVKTCWVRLSSFRKIAGVIKDRFDGASKVYQGNSGSSRTKSLQHNLIPLNPNHKSPGSKDLVYYEQSPSFCDHDRSIGHRGTRGRECNATRAGGVQAGGGGVDGCDVMCCGRGYRTEAYETVERCNCVFHWCCEVTCQKCRRTKERHICL